MWVRATRVHGGRLPYLSTMLFAPWFALTPTALATASSSEFTPAARQARATLLDATLDYEDERDSRQQLVEHLKMLAASQPPAALAAAHAALQSSHAARWRGGAHRRGIVGKAPRHRLTFFCPPSRSLGSISLRADNPTAIPAAAPEATWGPRDKDESGIGGAESAVISMATEFARLGWHVEV